MKKLNIILLMALGMMLTVSCETDRDSNPTLQDPTEFVLNVPAYASTVYDLQHSSTLELTCSQPNYGFPLEMKYVVQVSLSGTFTDAAGETPATYKTLKTSYSTARMNVSSPEIADAIVELSGIEEEDDFNQAFKDPTNIFIRLQGSLANDMKPILSNVIELPQVKAYYAPMALPEEMYYSGSMTEWKFDDKYEFIPVHSGPGKFWKIIYFDADAEVKFNAVKKFDGGEFGYEDTIFPNAEYAGVENSNGNIKITNAGWYLVVITVVLDGRTFINTVEFQEPKVYLCGDAAGGSWGANDDYLFTVPETANGEFVSPAFTVTVPDTSDGGIRACIKLEGQEWWHTEFMTFDGTIEYRGTGNDQSRVGGTAGQKVHFNFADGTGSIK